MPLLLGLVFLCISFVLWREFKDQHDPEEIFTLTCLLAVVGLLAGKLGLVAAVVAMITALIIWCRKMKWNWGEWLDALGLYGILGLMLYSWYFVFAFGLLWLLKRYYRRFSWYKSGKPGFVGLFAVTIFGLSQIVFAFLTKTNVYSAILGGWMIVASQVILWLRKK